MSAARLVFLGPPGVGKGTQAARVARASALAYIATGDILRRAIADGTPVGKKARAFMDQGELVPDAVVLELVAERLAQQDAAAGFLCDGFPRTRPQAEALEALLAKRRTPLSRVVAFTAADEVLIERLGGRRTCRGCQATFHVAAHPPRQAGRCDHCGGELYQRTDDREEAIRTRLVAYRRDTEPLAAFYRERGLLASIDAAQSIDAVEAAVAAVLTEGARA